MAACSSTEGFLKGLCFAFVPKRISKLQQENLTEKVIKFGGHVDSIGQDTTHVLFHESITFEEGMKSLKLSTLPKSVVAVTVGWLPACIAKRMIVSIVPFQVKQQACSEIKELKLPKKNCITFGISGTSKFPEAKLVTKYSEGTSLGVTIRKTFVFGSKYGLGVFALFPVGERQIGWVPERNKSVFNTVEKMMQETPHVSLHKVSIVRVTEKFERINIEVTVFCS